MPRASALLVRFALVFCLTFGVVSPLVAASSPPQSVVPVGEEAFVEQASRDGYDVGASDARYHVVETNATARVTIDDDGSAEWTVRHHVENEATLDAWRDDPDELDAVVAATLDHYTGAGTAEAHEDVETRLDGDTVVVTLTDPRAVQSSIAGQRYVEYFRVYHGGGTTLGTERLTVTLPAETTISHTPTGDVDGRTLVVTDEYPAEGALVFGSSEPLPGVGEAVSLLSNDDLGERLSHGVGVSLFVFLGAFGLSSAVGLATRRESAADRSVVTRLRLPVLAFVGVGLLSGMLSLPSVVGAVTPVLLFALTDHLDDGTAGRWLRYRALLATVAVLVSALATDSFHAAPLGVALALTVSAAIWAGRRSREGFGATVTGVSLVAVGGVLFFVALVVPMLENNNAPLWLLFWFFFAGVLGGFCGPLFVAGRLVGSGNSKRLTGPQAETTT